MRQILAMTRKEFLLWAQKPGSWVIVFIVPFFFIWIMQAVFGSTGTPVVTVFAVNEDAGAGGAQALMALQNTPNLKVDELETREEADQRVGSGERMAAIIIPAGFTDSVKKPSGAKIDIIVDPARDEQAHIVVGLVNSGLAPIIVDTEVSRGVESSVAQLMQSVSTALVTTTPTPTGEPGAQTTATAQLTPGDQTTETVEATPDSFQLTMTAEATPDEFTTPTVEVTPTPEGTGALAMDLSSDDALTIQKFLTAALKGIVSSQVEDAIEHPQVQLTTEAVGSSARKPSLLDYLVPGYSLMFVFFLIANLAVTVVEERQTGTLNRLLIAPISRSQILLGKMLPYFLIAVVQLIVVLLVSRLAFGIDLGSEANGSTTGLALLIVASSAAMAGLGILVAAFARTEGQADGLAIVLVLAMAVISGAMFPSITIPGLNTITPHYWAMQGFLNVIARGQGLEGALGPAGILLIMGALFFTVGAIRFRFE